MAETTVVDADLYEGEAKNAYARTLSREHTLLIEYCVPCNYHSLAMKALDEILGGWAPLFKQVELLPTSWGTFEVHLDGELIFSKYARDRHAKPGEIRKAVEDRLGPSFDYADHAPTKVDERGMPSH
jgi:selenoprotein W-related protein